MLCPFSISQCVRCPPNGNFIESILCFSTVEEPPWLTERLAKGTVGQWFISSLLTFEHKLKLTPEWPTTKSKSTKKLTRFNHSSISFGPYGYRFCFVSQGTKFLRLCFHAVHLGTTSNFLVCPFWNGLFIVLKKWDIINTTNSSIQ